LPYIVSGKRKAERFTKLMLEIVQHRQSSPEGHIQKDLLDLMIEGNKVDSASLSNKVIKDNLFTFFLAGHETSAVTLTWVLYELSLNQEIQKKAREEVDFVLNGKSDPDWDDVSKLDYIQMIVKETLRKHPPVIATARMAAEPVNIGGYSIPTGTFVLLSIYAIHHDEKQWPDPYRFDPERFTVERSEGRDPYAWVPFSAGPRNCLGMKFAITEMKITLAIILKRFEIFPDPSYKLTIGRSLTLRTANSLHLKLKPRS